MRIQISLAAAIAIALAPATAAAQGAPQKFDLALRQARTAGCSQETVIIRTQRGYRAGLTHSLRQHGDTVEAEHPSIDAVTARVHCDDLATLAGFPSVLSISHDAIVQAGGVPPGKARKDPPAKSAATTGRSEKLRVGAGLKAAKAQASLFDTLGVDGRRRPSTTSPYVMLGDIGDESDPSQDDANAVGPLPPLPASAAVGVAVIDSGIDPAIDFDGRITHFYEFTAGRIRSARPSDRYGHGTHVAGLIASRFVGVAPEVRLVGLQVLDARGQGRTSDVIRAIEFATANKDALGIRVINISLGHPIYEPAATDPLVQAVEHAVRAGLVVVAAAGNFGTNPATGEPGYAGIVSPGNAPSALTVGAAQTFGTRSRADDRIAPYSSRGPSWYDAFAKPDIAAPGHNMLSIAARKSALRMINERRGGLGDYMRLSGTSMAAAVSSGVVSLMLQTNPHLTPNALKMALQFTAIPIRDASGAAYDLLAQGSGSLNAAGALQLAVSIDATQPVGAKWLAYGMPMQTVVGGETYAWSQSMIWGPHRVFGDGIIDENRPAWATSVVWGDGTSDDNIVWGTPAGDEDNIVWGTLFDEGDNIVWGTNFLWSDDDNIVWGTSFDDDNIVWGTSVVWGNALLGFEDGDNIVWGTFAGDDDNIVWGTLLDEDTIVWGTLRGNGEDADNIVWGTSVMWGDRIVRGVRLAGLARGVRQ